MRRAEAATLLARSSPADGAVLSRSPEKLVLIFARPARLHEVTVSGADGSQIPMMVTAVGEVERFSLPLPQLGKGSYTAGWRASSGDSPFEGSIRFTIR